MVKLLSLLVFLCGVSTHAMTGIFDGATGGSSDLSTLVQQIKPGQIVLMGEVHDSEEHHKNQVQLLKALTKARTVRLSVGMEFIAYPFQSVLDQYLFGVLDEASFLKQVGWGGFPFDWYRDQVFEPKQTGGWTYAINAPREVTRYVARNGLENLPPNIAQHIADDFQVGNANYFERFKKVMMGEQYNLLSPIMRSEFQLFNGGHVGEEQLKNYFAAQSIWDDTMAIKAIEAMKNDPNGTLVILVGEFHVQYGGGLKDRLITRGFNNVLTISQTQLSNPDNKANWSKAVLPHSKYGPRADFVWMIKR